MKPFKEMTQWELWDAMQIVEPGSKEMRQIHKCLKKYHDAVPFIYRYPDGFSYPMRVARVIISVIILIVNIVTLLIQIGLLLIRIGLL